MATVQTSRPSPLLIVLGVLVMAGGGLILAGLGMTLYSEAWSRLLTRIGIPTVLLTELAGLAAVFGGGALVAALVAVRRRGRR